jgi:diguanylate cyclase (GGDEF)-like protein
MAMSSSNPNLLRAAESIRHIIEETAFDYDGEPLRVIVSAGVAALAPGDTMQSVVERADGLLYRAKEEGRNRVARSEVTPSGARNALARRPPLVSQPSRHRE